MEREEGVVEAGRGKTNIYRHGTCWIFTTNRRRRRFRFFFVWSCRLPTAAPERTAEVQPDGSPMRAPLAGCPKRIYVYMRGAGCGLGHTLGSILFGLAAASSGERFPGGDMSACRARTSAVFLPRRQFDSAAGAGPSSIGTHDGVFICIDGHLGPFYLFLI